MAFYCGHYHGHSPDLGLRDSLVTPDELRQIMPHAGDRAERFAEPLRRAMIEFEIDTPERQAAFLAQIAHESGSLRYVKEIASGEAYEGRTDLGNVRPGDGVKYKGRGLLQITGRHNYAQCGEALGLDLISQPDLLEEAENACRSAAWFWKDRGLNELADRGDFKLITRRINGGYNGYQDRLAFYSRAQKILGFAIPWLYGIAGLLVITVGMGIAVKVQSARLNTEKEAHAVTRAQLKAFKAETERIGKEAEARVKQAFEKQERITGEVKNSYEKRLAALNAKYRRLRDDRASTGGGAVPAVPDASRPVDDAARDTRLLEVLRYAEEQTAKLVELQEWVRQQSR